MSFNPTATVHIWDMKVFWYVLSLEAVKSLKRVWKFLYRKKKKQNREKQHQEMGQHWLLALRTGSAACLGHTWKVHTAIAYQAFNEQSSQRWRLLMSSKSWAHYIFFFLNHTIQLFMCKWFVQRGFSDIAIETTTTFISHLTSKKKKKSISTKIVGTQSLSGYSFMGSFFFHSHSVKSSEEKNQSSGSEQTSSWGKQSMSGWILG